MNLLRYRHSYSRPDALIIREAANLVFSRISLKENQAQAKAHVIYTLREARHCGYAVTADAIRFKSVDVDLRSIADFSFIKSVGVYGLPSELKWLYKYFEAYSLMHFPPENQEDDRSEILGERTALEKRETIKMQVISRANANQEKKRCIILGRRTRQRTHEL